MEIPKNKLSPYAKDFFHKLKIYLDTPIFYFGSVQRNDYFPKYSDIDVDIFTDDEAGTILKLQNFLNIPYDNFKKFAWTLNINNKLVHGHKIMFKNPENDLYVEFSIYNIYWKNDILKEHNGKQNLPWYATIYLIIIKLLYYSYNIIPASWYIANKRYILTSIIGKKEDHFVVMDLKTKNT